MKRTPKQKFYVAMGLILFLLLLYGKIPVPQIFIYNHTESIPKGWYLLVPSRDYEVGDIVGYDVPEEIRSLALRRGWLETNDIMMKKIGALEGDSYEVTKKEFFVCGQYMGKVFTEDRQNQPMPFIRSGKHHVKSNEFLPVTSHPYSFDGRYYGPLPLDHIRFKAIPITAFHF